MLSIRAMYKPCIENPILNILNDFNSPYKFHKTLKEYNPSPLYSLPALAQKLGVGKIYLKNEAERFGINAIKMLGASYAMYNLINQNQKIKCFCTATDGNHGRSVAWSARRLYRKAFIFVPEYTVASRIKSIENEGAEVYKIKGNYDDAINAATQFSDENNCTLIQDFSWNEYKEIPASITAGYYTQLKELEEQIDDFSKEFDLIIVQCGNGSWPSAVTHFIRTHRAFDNIKIVCIEPIAADGMLASIKAGKLISSTKSQITIMAGLNCGTPSQLAFDIMRHGGDAFISIPDSYTIEAMKLLYKPSLADPKIKAGESGAAGLAGLLAIIKDGSLILLRHALKINSRTRILIFNTEGITDPNFFHKHIT